jgi:hypothetical protein
MTSRSYRQLGCVPSRIDVASGTGGTGMTRGLLAVTCCQDRPAQGPRWRLATVRPCDPPRCEAGGLGGADGADGAGGSAGVLLPGRGLAPGDCGWPCAASPARFGEPQDTVPSAAAMTIASADMNRAAGRCIASSVRRPR